MVYKQLEEAKVCNIPRCIASGNISTDEYHATKTSNYPNASWACHSGAHFIPHWHYCITLDVIGQSLTTFQSSYEMVAAVQDALHGKVSTMASCASDNTDDITLSPYGCFQGWILASRLKSRKYYHHTWWKGITDWLGFLKTGVFGDRNSKMCDPNGKRIYPWHSLRFRLTCPEIILQGTWQLMSLNLVSMAGGVVQHTFQDDLESSIYILLWTILMYLTCTPEEFIPFFLTNVLDPQPCRKSTGFSFAKADFLRAQMLLDRITFPNEAIFHDLTINLANLFATRYIPWDIEGSEVKKFWELFKSHDYTIHLFDQALLYHSMWPLNNAAVRQHYDMGHLSRTSPQIKTNWDTGVTFLEFNQGPADSDLND